MRRPSQGPLGATRFPNLGYVLRRDRLLTWRNLTLGDNGADLSGGALSQILALAAFTHGVTPQLSLTWIAPQSRERGIEPRVVAAP